MSPLTNGSISLMGPLPDAILVPFDSISSDEFFAAAPPLAVEPTRLLLPPLCGGEDHGSEGSSSNSGGSAREFSVAAPGSSSEVTKTTAAADAQTVARTSPPLPLVKGKGTRTSAYRGVTRHRWTLRYEAHLWDNTAVRREGKKRKGRQVYLGGYEKEENAARAYDLAALKYWGIKATTNFPKESYIQEMEEMQNMSRQELVASLRRKSSGFSRGVSTYRGVTRHHQHGRWQARISRVAGNKDLYLGTFATEEKAAEAYDIAALKFRGDNAVTNFEPSRYNLEAIALMSDLPVNGQPLRQLTKAAAEAQGQVTIAAPDPFVSQQQSIITTNTGVPSYLLHNLLQLPPLDKPLQALPLSCYGFVEPSFCWPLDYAEMKVDAANKEEVGGRLRQLASSAANNHMYTVSAEFWR